jgi:Domain of unknown function (DUF3850)
VAPARLPRWRGFLGPVWEKVALTIELKCWPDSFDAIAAGVKTCEVRDISDRDFCVGDLLKLRRWDPVVGMYTGDEAIVQVRNIDTTAGSLHLFAVKLGPGGHVARIAVLSIRLIETTNPRGERRSHV